MTRILSALSLAIVFVPSPLAPPQVTAAARSSAVLAPVREITIPAGTRLRIRLDSRVSSVGSRVEDRVDGTLTAPLRIRGVEALPTGTHVRGVVTSVHRAGKVKGRASFSVSFRTLQVGAESYPMAARLSRLAPATKQADAAKIGVPAAGGAVIGALVGGKKGAAAGAAVGGGAGTAAVLSTRGKEVGLARGAVVSVTLQKPVVVRAR